MIRLHQSIANTMLRVDPLQAWLEHPELGGEGREPSSEMEKGTIIHGMLLGGSNFEEIDAPDWRTKAAREARDAVRQQGRVPVLKHKLVELQETVGACRAALLSAGIDLLRYDRERYVEWLSPEGVACGGTLDAVNARQIVDIKTAHTAHPEKFARHVYGFGYDLQAAAYMEAMDELEPEHAGRRQYIWAAIELDPPFRCLVRPIGAQYLELGRQRWTRAKALWKRCLENNDWPDYTEGSLPIDPPAYIVRREEELLYESQI